MFTVPALTDPSYVPKLRIALAAERRGDGFVLFDQRNAGRPITFNRLGLELIRQIDGVRSLQGLHSETGVPLADVAAVVSALDEALLLDGPRWQEFIRQPVRSPVCVGVYPDSPDGVRRQMRSLFTAKGGAGMPNAPARSAHGRLRAVLLPHMDYTRGNVTYGYGFRELFEATDARLFVIVATSHYSPARFTLSRQNFATPLGLVETDQGFVDRVVKRYGDGLFDDPAAHVPEHSIELELPPLQFLYESVGPVRIVPLLVGSYHEHVLDQRLPTQDEEIQRMAEALAAAEAEAGEPVCYLISGDLAHIGPKFDHPDPVNDQQLTHSREQDERLLNALVQADSKGYFRVIAEEEDRRNICGLPPTYLTLLAARPSHGRVLHYQQYVHPDGYESVSFASVAFYGSNGSDQK
jgi:hypothetical protein